MVCLRFSPCWWWMEVVYSVVMDGGKLGEHCPQGTVGGEEEVE